MARRDRPGYLPGTPNWPIKFVLAEMIERRATGRPDPEARRHGARRMPGLPARPVPRPAPPGDATDRDDPGP